MFPFGIPSKGKQEKFAAVYKQADKSRRNFVRFCGSSIASRIMMFLKRHTNILKCISAMPLFVPTTAILQKV